MLLQFNHLKSHPNLTHAITTVTVDGITPFNLADHVGPKTDDAIENRRRLCNRLNLPFDRLTVTEQVHRGQVAAVDPTTAGAGCTGRIDSLSGFDGMVTHLRDTPLMTLSADCPLVLLFDPTAETLSCVHASWRSLADGIIDHAITLMADKFGTNPKHLLAGVGPSAGPCCYEVQQDFCKQIANVSNLSNFVIHSDGRMHFDLWHALSSALVSAGVPKTNVEMMGICTLCDKRFFSYRREGEKAGRFAMVAAITSRTEAYL